MDAYDSMIELELKTEKFYRDLAEKIVNPSLKNVLTKLANDKKEHVHLINTRDEHLFDSEKMENLIERPHVFDYMKDFEFKPEELDHKALYHEAHHLETELVDHYKKMLEGSHRENEKNLLDLLLKQELYHIEVIDELYKGYTDKIELW